MSEHGTTEELSPVKRALVEIRELRARVAELEAGRREPIAVVGMGLRLPGGVVDASTYWQLLLDGVDAITEVPADRWDVEQFYDPDPDAPGRMSTRWGGFVEGIDGFDHEFFGIAPREAASLDPQQRLLLEVAWEALDDASIPPTSLAGSSTGVFLGIANSDHLRLLLADPASVDTYTTTGNALSIAAGRLAYVLGAHGPAISVDTACSSSLVAVHLALQSLRSGECDLALAGGVNLILAPELTINFSLAHMMAADGRCKTFDAAADGYVRSEGCGLVALRRLSDARRDGQRVLAVIRGSAVNQDGRSGGLTAPNGAAQVQVLRAAAHDAGVEPADVGYVEAHGTGTLLGDPIEVAALGEALCPGRDAGHPLLVGSVKTNIGHTESAAGIAGLMKAVLVLRHGTVPPHLHLHEPNPHIAASALPIAVPTVATPWPPGQPRVAGVSSFGLSGTNAHVVLEAPAADTAPPARVAAGRHADHAAPPRPAVVTVSARSDDALDAAALRLAALLDAADAPPLDDVARATQLGRSHLSHRLAVVAADAAAATRLLREAASGELPPDPPGAAGTFCRSPGTARADLPVAFVYSGHGALRPGAGAGLYRSEPVFAAAIDRCAALLRDDLSVPLTELLFAPAGAIPAATRTDMSHAQPALFALQVALTDLWAAAGVRPTVVAGHSAGEYAAAVAAGVLSLDDAVGLIATRGRLMSSLEPGRMVALFADEAAVAAAVARRAEDVGIAAVNGPTTTVVSGRADAVAAVVAELGLEPAEVRELDIPVAAHSPLVEPVLDELARAVARIPLRRPTVALVSSMTGGPVDHELTDPGYWRDHLRRPVRFADVFVELERTGCRTFVEIGPHPTLVGLGRRAWTGAPATWAASLRDGVDDRIQFASGLAAAHASGAEVDWAALDRSAGGSGQGPFVELPAYPWQRVRHWVLDTRPGPSAALSAPRWPAALAAAEAQAGQIPVDLDLASTERAFTALERFAVSAITHAVRELGAFTEPGSRASVADVLAAGHVRPAHGHLVGRWLGHLAAAGLLRRDGDDLVADRPLPAVELDAEVAALGAGLGTAGPLRDYAVRCARALARVVTGQEEALGTLFPDGTFDTVDFLYGQWVVPRYFNAIVRAAAAGVATARTGPLRVLEVGAGTGSTTAAVLPALPAERTTYDFTDVSDFFLARAGDRFRDARHVRFSLLDLERAPQEQGVHAGAYDVVVAANVLHATRDLDRTLAHVRTLLAPGGVLVAYEGTHHPAWFDITTGLIEGWQLFDDTWRSDVPLLTPDVWAAALVAAGFDEVAALPAAGAPTAGLLHHVLLARAGGEDAAAHAHPRAAGIDTARGGAAPGLPVGQLQELVLAAVDDERGEVMLAGVRRAVAQVLRVEDAERLPRTRPLLELGFDSLMALELRNVLRAALDRPLPSTLLFDHPNIEAISAHLLRLVLGDDGGDAETEGDLSARVATPRTEVLGDDVVAALSDDEAEALLLQRLAEMEP